MLRTWDLSGANWPGAQSRRISIPRSRVDVESAMPIAKEIVEKVRLGSSDTILKLTSDLDGIRPKSLRVPVSVIEEAVEAVGEDFKSALLEAAARVRRVSKSQIPNPVTTEVIPGGIVTASWIPIDRVGLYVPGGRAAYPSSVVMNVVPAQVAGVKSMMIMSPPNQANDGWPHRSILAAAGLLGIDEIYAVGGAQAVAMAAYGIGCNSVDMVTGPGNIFVTAAKRALSGLVAIDSEAGPTEVGIIADGSADPKLVAADLISQAEHDVVAAAVLITPERDLISKVNQELQIQVARTKHRERITEALNGPQSMAILVDDLNAAVEVANSYAAEHLEIHTQNAHAVASQIRNAGAVFIGNYSPVSLGDYLAGSNHVLPTGGCACHSSGLSVTTFLKLVNLIEYSSEALTSSAQYIKTLALSEDLPAHWEAIMARLKDAGHE